MTITEKFFVECVKKGITGKKITEIPEMLDYKQLYKLCASHSMSVIVLTALEEVKDILFDKFLVSLTYIAKKAVKKDIQSEYDLNLVLEELEKGGVKYMPLKGFHLKKLYPNTAMRYASDYDILIDAKERKKLLDIYKNIGLKTERYDEHHDIMYFSETKTIFEFHKSLFVGKLKEYFGVGFERAKLKEGYKGFYELNKEDFYISILAHSAYHFAESAGVGIRYLADIFLFRKAHKLDYYYIDEELKKCNLLKFKNEFEKVCDFLFEEEKEDDFTEKLALHILESSILENESKKIASEVVSNNAPEENIRKKAIGRKIFLSFEQMVFLFPVLKKAKWLLPFCHIARWLKVIFTRPKAIYKLKQFKDVDTNELNYMKEIRSELGIEHL